MTDAFVYTIAGKLRRELDSPALRQFGLRLGVKDKLERLQGQLSIIIRVVEEQLKPNSRVLGGELDLDKLEDAVYDADDLLDEVSRCKVMMTRRAKKVRYLFSHSILLTFRLKIGRRLEAILETLDAIANDWKMMESPNIVQDDMLVARPTSSSLLPDIVVGRDNDKDVIKRPLLESSVEEHVSVSPIATSSSLLPDIVVGRDNDKDVIIRLLTESSVEEHVSVIPIVGMGGSGKTTLAQHVFNAVQVSEHFEIKIWVHVGDEFDVKHITKCIVEAVTTKRVVMDRMKEELKNAIDGKKYLLVLDDVRKDDTTLWLELKELLMGGARGSKILITTRMQEVAQFPGRVTPYPLKNLSPIDAWFLFQQVAFVGGVEPQSQTLVKIGKDIVDQCQGLPLAIRIVGSLLRCMTTEKEWLSVKNRLSGTVQKNDFWTMLKLTYDNLPPSLKPCFAYCSVFPKDHRIGKKTLMQLWMAHGFIKFRDEMDCLEEVGDVFFDDLLSRSLFQDAELELDNVRSYVRSFKMHDLIHDLAQSVVGSTSCANDLDADARTRHVWVNIDEDSSWEIPTGFPKANKLRSLFLEVRDFNMNESKCNKVISSFKRL